MRNRAPDQAGSSERGCMGHLLQLNAYKLAAGLLVWSCIVTTVHNRVWVRK